jgi:hypothetical protein
MESSGKSSVGIRFTSNAVSVLDNKAAESMNYSSRMKNWRKERASSVK